ncbi:hypothetical protein NL676_036199 [Syzygium grande]|nr:hypothetical protein NL676_036199 [Syzygium grande]
MLHSCVCVDDLVRLKVSHGFSAYCRWLWRLGAIVRGSRAVLAQSSWFSANQPHTRFGRSQSTTRYHGGDPVVGRPPPLGRWYSCMSVAEAKAGGGPSRPLGQPRWNPEAVKRP